MNAFCTSLVMAGQPLSLVGEHNGLPVVEQYNGSNYCGVSLHSIATNPEDGIQRNIISIAVIGCSVNIPSVFIKNSRLCHFIEPDEKHSWLITQERNKRSAGLIVGKGYSICEVKLI